jgi:quercetin dioxygenase-like cupin family protein
LQAYAGAVYEDKKPILPNGGDYLIKFNVSQPFPAGTPGSIVRSTAPVPATTIPMALFTLQKCGVLSFHYHPLGSEQLFVTAGEACLHDMHLPI